MSPRKSSTDKTKKKCETLHNKHVLLKCTVCSTSFPSSNLLVHHVFNEHDFQPTIYLEHVQSVEEALINYKNSTNSKNRKRSPVKPKEKKSPGRKRKSLGSQDIAPKPKRPKKDKKAVPNLKAALVDTDGYSIPKIKIGRFNTTNAFNLDYTQEDKQSPIKETKDIPLNNRLEPIVNSSTLTSTSNSTPSFSSGTGSSNGFSSGRAVSTDDGLSTLMSEVYNVLDGQDSTSLNLTNANGDSSSDFLEMREIQGLYDDDMTYSHLASAFEIPQIKAGSSLLSSYQPGPNSLLLNSSQVLDYTSSNFMDSKSANFMDDKNSSKMSPVDSLSSLSHNLESLLNKPPSSCMLESSTNPYMMNSSLPPGSNSAMNNSLPNHNMASSAFTSTNQKPSLANHNSAGSAFMLTSGGTSTSGVPSPGPSMSPHKSASPHVNNSHSPSMSPHVHSPAISPHVHSPAISPHVHSPAISPHVHSPAISPHVHSPAISPHVHSPNNATPSSPHPQDTKKKSGLNVIPTEKLMDNSKQNVNQLVNSNPLVHNNQMVDSNPLMSSNPPMSSYYPDSLNVSSSGSPYSSYYNPMYSSYMNQMSYSSAQFMSSPSSMSPYFNNFYTAPSMQSVEDAQYKRVDQLGPPNSMGPPQGPPPFKRPEDPAFKRPGEPPNKQPKIVPKKLSSLLQAADGKKPGSSSNPRHSAPYSIQRPSSHSSIMRPPSTPLQVRCTRPPPAPSLKMGGLRPALPPLVSCAAPRPPSAPPGMSISPAKPSSVVSSNSVESPAASALKKRGITISSVSKPATRKLTSSVNITPVVKKPSSVPERVGQVDIVPKINPSGPSRPVELVKDAECNLGIPVIDLSNQSVLANLSSMGITSFIPVNQMRGSNQILGLPIINTAQLNRRMDDLGASGVLNLGSVYKLK